MTQLQLILALDWDWAIFYDPLYLTTEFIEDWIWVSKSIRNTFQPTAVRDRTSAVHPPNRKEERNLFCNMGEDQHFLAHIRAVAQTIRIECSSYTRIVTFAHILLTICAGLCRDDFVSQLLQYLFPSFISSVFLTNVMLLGHEWIIEGSTAELAELLWII